MNNAIFVIPASIVSTKPVDREKVARILRQFYETHGQPPHLEVLIDGDEVEVKEFEMEKQE